MGATMLLQSNISQFIIPRSHSKCKHHTNVMSFTPLMSLTTSTDKVVEASEPPKLTCYQDSWLDRVAINHISHNLQAVSGIQIKKDGFDGLLETCKVVTAKYDAVQQRQLSLDGLKRSIPPQVFPLLKALVPQHSKFTREFFAKVTALCFTWLIGPSELKESEFNGRREKNVVHVKRCRFLENSNCVGMCTNLCKFPTQTFIKESLGMPVTLVPNFEDMSCDMIYGEEPPAPDVDPVAKQPCYKLCKINSRHMTQKCS